MGLLPNRIRDQFLSPNLGIPWDWRVDSSLNDDASFEYFLSKLNQRLAWADEGRSCSICFGIVINMVRRYVWTTDRAGKKNWRFQPQSLTRFVLIISKLRRRVSFSNFPSEADSYDGMMQLFLLNIALLFVSAVWAFPSGPGSCISGTPLMGSHLNMVSSGALSKYGITLKINGTSITPGKAYSFKAGKSLPISLTSGKSFKGFLIRIGKSGVNTKGFLTKGTSATVQVPAVCTSINIGGISHNSNSPKTSIQGRIKVPSVTSGMKLEVTVVVQNSSGKSVWYKSDYTLNAVA